MGLTIRLPIANIAFVIMPSYYFASLIALLVQGLAPYWPLRLRPGGHQRWPMVALTERRLVASQCRASVDESGRLVPALDVSDPPLGGGLCWLLLSLLVALVDAAIWLWVPQTIHYWGLSGALHGLFAIAACLQWLTQKRQAVLWLAGIGRQVTLGSVASGWHDRRLDWHPGARRIAPVRQRTRGVILGYSADAIPEPASRQHRR